MELVDESVPEHRDTFSSSHELLLVPRAKVVPSEHNNFFTHFPKDRNCDICLRTKNYKGSLQKKRTGTVVPRADDLITADYKVLSEGYESRHNHRYAVVVQNLATQWIHPYKTKTSQETQKELAKVLGADEETKSDAHRQFPRIWQILRRSFLESLYVNAAQIGN